MKSTLKRELEILDSNESTRGKGRIDEFTSFAPSENLQEEYKALISNNRLVDLGMLNDIMSYKVLCTECGSSDVSFRDKFTIGCANVMQIHCISCERKDEAALVRDYRNSGDWKSQDNLNSKNSTLLYPRRTEGRFRSEAPLGSIKKRFIDYDVNVQALLSAYFLGVSGDAIGLVLASLDMPNIDQWRHQYYRNSEEMALRLQEISISDMNECLNEELILTMREMLTAEGKSREQIGNLIDSFFKNVKDNKLTNKYVGLDVSYDMGWQKRSSGRRYDSTSGHSFLIGLRSQKIIGFIVYSKKCKLCDRTGIGPVR